MAKVWLKSVVLVGVLGAGAGLLYVRYVPGAPSQAGSASAAVRAPEAAVPVAVRRTAGNRSGVVKCVASGRTIYTQDECPGGTRQVEVKLRDNTLGFVMPSAPKPATQPSAPALKEAMMERLIEKGSTRPDQ